MKPDPPQILLIEDTREQQGYSNLFQTPCIREALPVGDYSIAGLQDRIGIERKSLPDLLSSLTHQRERFERELAKARPYHFFCVIVEASARDILEGRFDLSCANPRAIWESVAAFTIRYCPFVFAGDRPTAARMTESLLLKFAREHQKATDAMIKAVHRFQKSA